MSIAKLPEIKSILSKFKSNYIKKIVADLDTLDDIGDILGRAIVDNPPFQIREGGMIREGFNQDVDYYRSIKNGGTDIMASIVPQGEEISSVPHLYPGTCTFPFEQRR